MSTDRSITCIDIGSSKIRTLIGYFDGDDGKILRIMGVGISDSNAMRKGNILDIEQFKTDIDTSLQDAEKMAGEQVEGAFISFNSSSFEVDKNKGIIAISGSEIDEADIERVMDMAKNGLSLPNREVLKVLPDSYIVDLEEGIKSPLKMSGRKLEVRANIFSVSSTLLSNIKKSINDVGIEQYDVIPNLISSPEGVLSKRQKELGVVCIDIGASTTGISVYEEGALKYSSILPIGGDSVTNDIALGLRTGIDTAEKLKIEYGHIGLDKIEDFEDEEIDLATISKGEDGVISKLYLSQIIQARYEELFFFIRDGLKSIGKFGMLPEGAILVGSGAKMKGLVDLGKDVLKLPVVVGVPLVDDFVSDTSISDPSYAGVIGTMRIVNKYAIVKPISGFGISSLFGSIEKVFKKILPK